jgi:UDP-N-acetylglucosamine acyltransferase
MHSSPPGTPRGVRIHPSAAVHPGAILEGDVDVGPGCTIGPGCLVLGTTGPVSVGADCTLVANVTLNGPISLGRGNLLYPNVCLGFAPQDLGFDASTGGSGCVIGDGNVFREGATVHRGKTTEPTRIGNGTLWMAGSHLGHDGEVGDGCTIGAGSVLGGHVHLERDVTIGAMCAVHQFARAGRGSVLTDTSGFTTGLPPWFVCTSINAATSVNVDGLHRAGATERAVASVRWVFDALYRSDRTPQQAIPDLEERREDEVVADYLRFMSLATRGICHGAGRDSRANRAEAPEGPAAREANTLPA